MLTSDLLPRVEACVRQALFAADAQERAAASAALEDDLPRDEHYLPALLRLSVGAEPGGPPENSLEVRKAACVILGKEIEAGWKQTPFAKLVHSPRAKALVRAHLLEAMLRAGSLDVLRLLSHCLAKVLARDHPHEWPAFEAELLPLLKSPTREELFVGLAALHALGKVRQHFVGPDRRAIEETADVVLPLFAKQLRLLAGELAAAGARPSPSTHLLVSALLKNTYRLLLVAAAHQVDLPPVCMSEAFDSALWPLCITWLARFPQHPPRDEQHRLYLNACKWLLRVLNKYLVKYANPAASQEKFFAVDWGASHGPALWRVLLAALSADSFPETEPRVKGMVLKALYFLLDSELVLTVQVLEQPPAEKARLLEALERALRLTEAEQAYFGEHPQEFPRNNDEKVQNDVSLSRFYCIKLLKALALNQAYLDALLHLCAARLAALPAAAAFERETVYSLLQVVHDRLLAENHRPSLLQLLERFLLPDLAACCHSFLLVRLLSLLANLVSPALPRAACEACFHACHRLARHPDQTVVSSAMLCLTKLVCLRPIREQLGEAEAQELLDLTLNSISLTEDDQLVSSLKSTLDCFSSYFEKDALAISRRVAAIVVKLIDHSMSLLVDDQDSREIEERSQVLTAAANCLAVLQDIVLYKAPAGQLQDAFLLLEPLFARCLDTADEGLLAESRLCSAGVYLLSSFAYRSPELPEGFFTAAAVLLYLVVPSPVHQPTLAEGSVFFKAVQGLGACEGVAGADQVPDECVRPILVLFFNVLGRLAGQIEHRRDFYGCRLIDGVLSLVKKVLSDNLKSFDETPLADCCLLLGAVAQTLHEGSAQYVALVVDALSPLLKAKNSPAVQSCSLFVLCSSLVALPLATLEYCSKTSFWLGFQAAWLGGEVPEPGVRLKTISLLGKLTLLKLGSELWSKVAAAEQIEVDPKQLLKSVFLTAESLLRETAQAKISAKQQEGLHEGLLLENIENYFAENDEQFVDFEVDEEESLAQELSPEERRRARLEQKLLPLFQVHESCLIFEQQPFGDAMEHFAKSVAGRRG